jgi:hypothetical protein
MIEIIVPMLSYWWISTKEIYLQSMPGNTETEIKIHRTPPGDPPPPPEY